MAEEKLVPSAGALTALPTLGREKGNTMEALTVPAPATMEQETNPWEAQAARFDEAARKLNLDDGIWKVLRYPAARDHRPHPGADGRRPD